MVDLIKKISRRLVLALLGVLALLFIAMVVTGPLFGRPYVALIVFLIGSLAGFVSIQRRLKKLGQDDLKLLAESWIYVWLSPLVGGVLALVLYLLFLSGLLGGQLFPLFKPGTEETAADGLTGLFNMFSDSPRDYAKLFFWSFVAGYSETFVTNVIGNFTKQVR